MPVQSDDTPRVIQSMASHLPAEFALIEYLGEGGHGVVLKAQWKTLQKNVALKLIKTDNAEETSRRVQRMQNEAKALAKLNHKNIVNVFQLGECLDGTPFLVCEFLEGVTLAQLLKKSKMLSPRTVVEIFSQILDALGCAHENGLLHRDIKPSNIMIVKDKESGALEVKLLDFGIARDFEQLTSDTIGLTRTIQISGSAPYMSPEQCRGSRLDQRSDLYSVACVLYECLCGVPPFMGETPMHTRYLQINDDAELPKQDKYASTAGRRAVFDLVMDGLSKNPDDRPPSAQDFKNRLVEALPQAEKRDSWTPKSHLKLKLLIAFACIASLAISVFFLAEHYQEQQKEKIETGRIEKGTKTLRSKPYRMRELNSAYAHLRVDSSIESMTDAVALVKEVDEFEKSLRSTKSDHFLHFSALRLKGLIEYRKGFYKESRKSWSEALKYCRLPDGRVSAEAVECYLHLSRIELAYDLGRAEHFAKLGIETAKKTIGPSGDNIFMDVPSEYANHAPICTSECYAVLHDISNRIGDGENAIKFAKLTEYERVKKERLFTQISPYISWVESVRKYKGVEDAHRMMKERQKELLPLIEVEDRHWEDLARYFGEMGVWFKKNNFVSDANECFNAASEIRRNHRGTR